MPQLIQKAATSVRSLQRNQLPSGRLGSSLADALWRLHPSLARGSLGSLSVEQDDLIDTSRLMGSAPGEIGVSPPWFLSTETYSPRAFLEARVASTLITRHAKAIGPVAGGFLDEFNISGGPGIPRQLLAMDMREEPDGGFSASLGDVERVAGLSVPLGHWGLATFGHFMLDALLQLYLNREILTEGSARVVHWPLEEPWMEDVLVACGAPSARRRILRKPVAVLQSAALSSALAAHGVYFPGSYSRPFFEWLRLSLVQSPKSERWIYVRRPKGVRRQILNQTELENLLIDRGFYVLDPAQISVADQAGLFSGAETIVSAWGSGLTLAPLLKGQKNVVELLPASVTDPWFFRQAAVHGLRYFPIVHAVVDEDAIVADLDRIGRRLDNLTD